MSRQVVGVTPGDWYSQALYEPTDVGDRFWQGLRDGEVGLTEIAASRLGVAAGDTVELPTVEGPKQYRVAGIFHPRMVNDAAVGDIVLVSEGWRATIGRPHATRSRSTIRPPPTRPLTVAISWTSAPDCRCTTTSSGARRPRTGITRFLQPLTFAAYVVMAAAGLSLLNVFLLGLVQRKRERAALRAIGVTSGQEQAVILANAGLLGLLVAGLAVLGGVGLTYLWSLGSPVFYGIKIEWGVLPLPLQTGVAGVFILVLTAAVYPVIHARRLEAVEVLRSSYAQREPRRCNRGMSSPARRNRCMCSRIAGLDMASNSLGGNDI